MATLDLGDGTGTSVLNGIVNYLQAGGSVTRVITASLLGTIVSPFIAVGDVIAGVGTFFSTPFQAGGEAIGSLFQALLEGPADLIAAGSAVSQNVLETFLGESLAGVLALPVATGVVMLSLFIISTYLNERETGNTIPGLPVDVPDVGPLDLGVEEEDRMED